MHKFHSLVIHEQDKLETSSVLCEVSEYPLVQIINAIHLTTNYANKKLSICSFVLLIKK